ncbi:MAG TPA: signal peptidase I [Acidobacteriaceae bacterium]|nr:signal peptidase I [Acidobacteriaceae bacterium]
MPQASLPADLRTIRPLTLSTGSTNSRVLPGSKAHHGVLATFRSLLEFLVMALFALTFVLQPFRIPSESMVPTLRVGDFLMVDKQAYEREGHLSWLLPPSDVHRGDLVVFHYPVDPSMHLVKRVVAVPGDRIRLRSGRVWINGRPLDEPYAFYSPSGLNDFRDNFPSLRETDPSLDPTWWLDLRRSVVNDELTVPPGQLFVLGDNRNNSEDSRYWGFVPLSDLVGRPFVVYFSLAAPDDGGVAQSSASRLRSAFSLHVLR